MFRETFGRPSQKFSEALAFPESRQMFFANFSLKKRFFENSILSGPDCLVLEWTYEKELDIYLKLYPFPTRCFK